MSFEWFHFLFGFEIPRYYCVMISGCKEFQGTV